MLETYAIRAVTNSSTNEAVDSVKEEQWQPLVKADGRISDDKWVVRKTHIMSDSEVPFGLVIQRKKVEVKDKDKKKRKNNTKKYKCIYRAIATNGLNITDSRVMN